MNGARTRFARLSGYRTPARQGSFGRTVVLNRMLANQRVVGLRCVGKLIAENREFETLQYTEQDSFKNSFDQQ